MNSSANTVWGEKKNNYEKQNKNNNYYNLREIGWQYNSFVMIFLLADS